MNIFQKVSRKTKDIALRRSSTEIIVRNATNNEPWGPTGAEYQQILMLCNNFRDYFVVMKTLWSRIEDHGKNWRHIYKALLVFDYLLRYGPESVVKECTEKIMAIKTLQEFKYIENDVEVGFSIRTRAKLIVELLTDEKRLKRERKLASKNKGIYNQSIGSNTGYIGPMNTYRESQRKYDSSEESSDSEEVKSKSKKKTGNNSDISSSDEEESRSNRRVKKKKSTNGTKNPSTQESGKKKKSKKKNRQRRHTISQNVPSNYSDEGLFQLKGNRFSQSQEMEFFQKQNQFSQSQSDMFMNNQSIYNQSQTPSSQYHSYNNQKLSSSDLLSFQSENKFQQSYPTFNTSYNDIHMDTPNSRFQSSFNSSSSDIFQNHPSPRHQPSHQFNNINQQSFPNGSSSQLKYDNNNTFSSTGFQTQSNYISSTNQEQQYNNLYSNQSNNPSFNSSSSNLFNSQPIYQSNINTNQQFNTSYNNNQLQGTFSPTFQSNSSFQTSYNQHSGNSESQFSKNMTSNYGINSSQQQSKYQFEVNKDPWANPSLIDLSSLGSL